MGAGTQKAGGLQGSGDRRSRKMARSELIGFAACGKQTRTECGFAWATLLAWFTTVVSVTKQHTKMGAIMNALRCRAEEPAPLLW